MLAQIKLTRLAVSIDIDKVMVTIESNSLVSQYQISSCDDIVRTIGTVNSVTRASTSAFDLKLKASVVLRRAIKPLAKARVFVFSGNDLVSSRAFSTVKMVNGVTKIIRIMDKVRIIKRISFFIN